GGAPQGDLAFGHDLQQGRLHLGGCTVDLVGQYEVDEDRPQFDVELLGGGMINAGADDVGGHQVGGELHARERSTGDLGQRGDRQCLGDTRYPFDEAVPSGDQSDQGALHHTLLADDDRRDLVQRCAEQSGRLTRCTFRTRGGRGAVTVCHVPPSRLGAPCVGCQIVCGSPTCGDTTCLASLILVYNASTGEPVPKGA